MSFINVHPNIIQWLIEKSFYVRPTLPLFTRQLKLHFVMSECSMRVFTSSTVALAATSLDMKALLLSTNRQTLATCTHTVCVHLTGKTQTQFNIRTQTYVQHTCIYSTFSLAVTHTFLQQSTTILDLLHAYRDPANASTQRKRWWITKDNAQSSSLHFLFWVPCPFCPH